MDETLCKLVSVAEEPYDKLIEWKKQTNRKIIGCHPMHVPEEIIHAAGVLPVTILTNNEPITLADEYLSPRLCSLVRSKFDSALRGKLDFLDGIVFPDICDFMQRIPDVWRRHQSTPFHFPLGLPIGMQNFPSRRWYLVEQFNKLRASLENFVGHNITDAALFKSVSIYNRNRSLLRRLYEFRRSDSSLFHAKDVTAVVTASMLMPKEEHNELLTNLLSRLEVKNRVPTDRVKLLLSGNLCDKSEGGLLDSLEEVGAVIIDDDLYVGSRYFATQVDETLPPIEALADRYIKDVPCPVKHDLSNDWGNYLLELMKRSAADGLVTLMVKSCDPHGYDYPSVRQKLYEAGVPHILIETEHQLPIGPLKIRLQAFVEMLKEKKNGN